MNKRSLLRILVTWQMWLGFVEMASSDINGMGGSNSAGRLAERTGNGLNRDSMPAVSTYRPTNLVLRERPEVGIHKPLLYYFIRDYPSYNGPSEGNYIKPWNLVVTNRDVESKLLRVNVNNADNKRNIAKKKNILYLTRFTMNTGAVNP